jgi:hypothetical protein
MPGHDALLAFRIADQLVRDLIERGDRRHLLANHHRSGIAAPCPTYDDAKSAVAVLGLVRPSRRPPVPRS